MFAITGITLNHASDIEVTPSVRKVDAVVPAAILSALTELPEGSVTLPDELSEWLSEQRIDVPSDKEGEWDGTELYVSWPGPGKDHWLSLDSEAATLIYEGTDRGWLSYFNDLHKGRNTGNVWQWFLDIFSVVVIIFTITGLQLLIRQAPHKTSTWPITGLGFLIPVLIMLVFIH